MKPSELKPAQVRVRRTLASVSYEGEGSVYGGSGMVQIRLLAALLEAWDGEVVRIAPHHHVSTLDPSAMERLGTVTVSFQSDATTSIDVDVLRHEGKSGPWVFVAPTGDASFRDRIEAPFYGRRFFDGGRHAYDATPEVLQRDALFFAGAVREVQHLIGGGVPFTYLLHDWQAAAVPLALAGSADLESRSFVVLHNVYDSRGVFDAELRRFGLDPTRCLGPAGALAPTILERALPLVEPRVITVSEQFEEDVFAEPLIREILAGHLQKPLHGRLFGNANGPFISLEVPPEALADARHGDYGSFRAWKEGQRKKAIDVLDEISASGDARPMGSVSAFVSRLRQNATSVLFVSAGRDDQRAKGFEVAAGAARDLLDRGFDAQFLFLPSPGDEGLEGLEFLQQLAELWPDRLLVLPYRVERGYSELVSGATFALVPSILEPFGLPNELYMRGIVGIGRACGGILQQIVPLRSAAAFSQAVKIRAQRWHAASAAPTGILFREPDNLPSSLDDWQAMNDCAYQGLGITRLDEREQLPTFRTMIDELRVALTDGIRVYQAQPALYFSMIVAGIDHIDRNFSWNRTAYEYVRHMTVQPRASISFRP